MIAVAVVCYAVLHHCHMCSPYSRVTTITQRQPAVGYMQAVTEDGHAQKAAADAQQRAICSAFS
jgi:hypothetical protein